MNKLLTLAVPVLAAAALAGCATQIPSNSKPYTCAEYNAMRAKVTANPSEAYLHADTLRFNQINMVGFKAGLPKHPSKAEVLKLIDDTTDAQAIQCRVAPNAIIHYTAIETKPGSVRLGYVMEYPTGEPTAAAKAAGDLRLGRTIADEKGMGSVKEFIQNCAAGSAPARACKLGGL